jgi:hypothetical protein
MKVVYIRFSKELDYKSVVNSFYIKKFLETVFGEFPTMMTPKNFTFDRDVLGKFIQEQYDVSKQYVIDTRSMPTSINEAYGEHLDLVEFEPDILIDDHLVTVNSGDNVLGMFVTEDDFEHIIDEL